MPTYVYHCDTCGRDFEATQRFSDDPLRICPEGHEGVRRVFTPAGIIFKGSGWYIKDSKGSAVTTASGTPSKPDGKEAKSTPEATAPDESGPTKTPSTEATAAT